MERTNDLEQLYLTQGRSARRPDGAGVFWSVIAGLAIWTVVAFSVVRCMS